MIAPSPLPRGGPFATSFRLFHEKSGITLSSVSLHVSRVMLHPIPGFEPSIDRYRCPIFFHAATHTASTELLVCIWLGLEIAESASHVPSLQKALALAS